MKLSIIATSAGLAAAATVHIRQTESTLKPFIQPSPGRCLSMDDTNAQLKSETCLGTLLYCRISLYKAFNETVSSTKGCIASRESAPLQPFIQPSAGPCIATQLKSEKCLGTLAYCEKGFYVSFYGSDFSSAEECLASREPGLTAELKLEY
ncbi:hypothetical protein MY11210_009586 [Beauveria gryllotalpidicola]